MHPNEPATNWFVITGAPSSGKTTLIHAIQKAGHAVVHEIARSYIELQISQGLTLKEIKADHEAFERRILTAKVTVENSLPPEKVIFFDRAVPDSIAYFVLAGLDPKEAVSKSLRNCYRKVFLLDRLALEKDLIRIEEPEIAQELDFLLEESYSMLGYEVIRIPVLPVGKRLELVLNIVKETVI